MEINLVTVNAITSKYRNSRSIWLDVEPIAGPDDSVEGYCIVLRGWDKVVWASDMKPDAEPSYFWNGKQGETLAFTLAEFATDDPEQLDDAKQSAADCAAELLELLADQTHTLYERLCALSVVDMSGELPTILLCAFGHSLDTEKKLPGRVGSYEDYKSGVWRKRRGRPAATEVADPSKALAVLAADKTLLSTLSPALQAELIQAAARAQQAA